MDMRVFWIGGTLAAALMGAVIWAASAKAGDLGGSCCADLEERVAELEAVAAHKGNRKVSLTISGEVSRALLWVDTPSGDDKRFVDNTNAPTRFRFAGEGRISKDWAAGFLYEIGLGNEPSIEDFINYPNSNDDLGVRHAAVWIKGPIGRLTLGKTSQATDNFDEISVANTVVASKLLSLGPVSAIYAFGFDLPFDGGRSNLVRYDTPSVQGFMGSASWSADKHWDAALKYANELSGFRIAGAVGYRQDDTLSFSVLTIPVEFKTLLAAASVMHMTSGIFVTGMYADSDFSGTHLKGLHVQAGIEAKLMEFGRTTFYGEWAQIDLGGSKTDFYGAGVVQKIDAAAFDIFAAYRHYDGDLQTLLAGMRIAF